MKKNNTGKYVADFDSTTSMVIAAASLLRGEERPSSIVPTVPSFLARAVNALSVRLRQKIYQLGGSVEALPPDRIDEVRNEQISQWITDRFPREHYTGAIIGSANGAGAHLAAALRMPVLPQTVLIPVRRKCAADDMIGDLEWGKSIGQRLLQNNPDCEVVQMHDPIQDRIMVEVMGYFRLKRLKLGRVYREFLLKTLRKGATIIVLDCRLSWHVTRVSDRFCFQVGGFGDVTSSEILEGSERINEFLDVNGSGPERWRCPKSTEVQPEAEWGYLPSFTDDVCQFADEHGFNVKVASFSSPDDLSPLVADFYSWLWEKEAGNERRLLIECFALLEPTMCLLTRSIPYWLAFNSVPSAEMLERYLSERESFAEINLMLMSNGIASIGITPLQRWKEILGQATQQSSFLGMDLRKYPTDLGSFGRYHSELKRRVSVRAGLPEPADVRGLENFLHGSRHQYGVLWDQRTPDEQKRYSRELEK